jgi:acetyl esterase/lipase
MERSPKTIHYGSHHSQVADLWLPAERDGDIPMVVLIHGGFWRAVYTKVLMNGLAKSVTARGWAAWNLEYRRVGAFGGGGGWPATFVDVATAIDHIASLPGIDMTRIVTCGHSAGGQLALWAAARGRVADSGASFTSSVALRGVVSLAGVVDLQKADELHLGNDAASKLLGGHAHDLPDRYATASPAALLPLGVPQVLIHGTDDHVVPPAMSEHYAKVASERGDRVDYVALEQTGHRELINANGSAWAETLNRLESLLA